MEHVFAGNRADTHQDQTYPVNCCGGNRKGQVLQRQPELSAQGGDDIADIGEEIIEAIGQLPVKASGKDRNHGRKFSERLRWS